MYTRYKKCTRKKINSDRNFFHSKWFVHTVKNVYTLQKMYKKKYKFCENFFLFKIIRAYYKNCIHVTKNVQEKI